MIRERESKAFNRKDRREKPQRPLRKAERIGEDLIL